MRRPVLLLGLALAGTPLAAQAVPDHLSQGIAAGQARDPERAFRHFSAALEEDSLNYEANWRAAQALIDIGKQTPDSVKSPERDSLYARAEWYARRAAELNPDDVSGHFVLAQAIGRASLTRSKKERVRRAAEIRAEATRALELDPRHDGANHVMGRWNAEIMRLSGFERFFAKTFLGGGIFNAASWDSATVYMERAVNLAPNNIYHHLDLGLVYLDRKRWPEARTQFSIIETLPVVDVMDPDYKRQAAARLDEISDKN
ncbi:MAG: hypothetical protein AB7I33_12455 [Gemmatimonadales bacterium]